MLIGSPEDDCKVLNKKFVLIESTHKGCQLWNKYAQKMTKQSKRREQLPAHVIINMHQSFTRLRVLGCVKNLNTTALLCVNSPTLTQYVAGSLICVSKLMTECMSVNASTTYIYNCVSVCVSWLDCWVTTTPPQNEPRQISQSSHHNQDQMG